MSSVRQLAAIMFTDIVGYTGMMQENESEALQLLEKQKKKLESEVLMHGGRILEFRGDGALCSFSSTLECVRAALALQLEMQKSPVVPLRIGIHTGDVTMAGDTIYGDGVNIASRMESLAQPGSILISDRVFEDIKNQKEIRTIFLGRYSLKNVKDDIGLYAISNPGVRVPDTTHVEGKGQRSFERSILVLPFVNLSSDPSQEYFSDGLTEELISGLSRLKGIRVMSRTTSMKFKNTTLSIRAISEETGATFIMEGSVRTHGNTLRITAQLIDAVKDVHLWADNYRGTLDDIFDIQEKVSGKIVDSLRLHLTDDEKVSLNKRYTDNTVAYQLYLQGRFFWNKRNEEGLRTAIRFFERSINNDPDYALAWAGLADSYNLLSESTNFSRKELFPRAKAAVTKALEIDNHLAEAHISLASILMINEWDWPAAEKEFAIGLELNPNYATGHHWYAEWLLYMGRTEEGLSEIGMAVDLDPVSQAILKDQGLACYYTRHYDQGIEKAFIALDLDPGFSTAHRLLSLCYLGKGMFDEALNENRIWGKLTGNDAKTKIAKAYILAVANRYAEARELLNEILLNAPGENDLRSIALIYVALNETDLAFEWLDKSFNNRESSLCSIKLDPKMHPVRHDSRYHALLKKMGLPTDVINS
jgi:TolB-like protein/class 3 adenylate cyclase/tetratricopeptide (TPR) repeat protein